MKNLVRFLKWIVLAGIVLALGGITFSLVTLGRAGQTWKEGPFDKLEVRVNPGTGMPYLVAEMTLNVTCHGVRVQEDTRIPDYVSFGTPLFGGERLKKMVLGMEYSVNDALKASLGKWPEYITFLHTISLPHKRHTEEVVTRLPTHSHNPYTGRTMLIEVYHFQYTGKDGVDAYYLWTDPSGYYGLVAEFEGCEVLFLNDLPSQRKILSQILNRE